MRLFGLTSEREAEIRRCVKMFTDAAGCIGAVDRSTIAISGGVEVEKGGAACLANQTTSFPKNAVTSSRLTLPSSMASLESRRGVIGFYGYDFQGHATIPLNEIPPAAVRPFRRDKLEAVPISCDVAGHLFFRK